MQDQVKIINQQAKQREEKLKEALITMYSILEKYRIPIAPTGSYVDGTFTAHSDLDVYVTNLRYSLITISFFLLFLSYTSFIHLSPTIEHDIEVALKENNIGFTKKPIRDRTLFTLKQHGVPVNIIVELRGDPLYAISHIIRNICASDQCYIDVVRVLKVYAHRHINRFPRGMNYPPVYPGSYFFAIATAICFGFIPSDKFVASLIKVPSVELGVKNACYFIGYGGYKQHTELV